MSTKHSKRLSPDHLDDDLLDRTPYLEIDNALDELAPAVYDPQTGKIDPLKLVDMIIDKLDIRDDAAARWAYIQVMLWRDTLEISCQLEGRQNPD